MNDVSDRDGHSTMRSYKGFGDNMGDFIAPSDSGKGIVELLGHSDSVLRTGDV